MTHDFDTDQLRRVLERCPEYRPGHHLGQPFMSAYQIAIRFAEAYPDHRLVRSLPLGGEDIGANDSVAKRIAHFLSQAIRHGTAGNIEGGFISHDNVDDFSFSHPDGRIRVSTLRSHQAHSIFRVRRANTDTSS